MSREHDHRPDGPPAPLVRPRFSRGRLAVGTAGLAAILGVGTYVVTSEVVNGSDHTAAQDVQPMAPLSTGPAVLSSATPSVSPSSSPSPVPTVDASGSPLPSHVIEEIREARRKMAKDGVPVKPPIAPKTASATSKVERIQKGSLQEGGIIRLVTARSDLTGQEELVYVAGGVKKYRNALCTQTFKFSTNPTPGKRDNLVMCWRTSAMKSVIAMVVDPKGNPSQEKAVKAIADKWRSMG